MSAKIQDRDAHDLGLWRAIAQPHVVLRLVRDAGLWPRNPLWPSLTSSVGAATHPGRHDHPYLIIHTLHNDDREHVRAIPRGPRRALIDLLLGILSVVINPDRMG
jgi:hypothetical protein